MRAVLAFFVLGLVLLAIIFAVQVTTGLQRLFERSADAGRQSPFSDGDGR